MFRHALTKAFTLTSASAGIAYSSHFAFAETANEDIPDFTAETADRNEDIPDLTAAARRHYERGAKAEAYKQYFTKSYDEVAEVVGLREKEEATKSMDTNSSAVNDELEVVQRLRRAVAKVLMERLGYTPEDLVIIGDDVDRMQGTGNPFPLAKLQKGEFVIDLGSGFGVDAILAGSKVGEDGRVVGVDLSVREVSDANKRVLARGISNVRFYKMDIERLAAIPDGSIDVVISNGGFCLVPNKRRAFQEIRRVLKPRGRFSISCTTLRSGYGSINKFMSDDEMSDGDYPSCMEVFMPMDAAVPLLEDLGFEDVLVDDSNSKMSVWDEVEAAMTEEVDREMAKVRGMLPDENAKKTENNEAKIMTDMVIASDKKKQHELRAQQCPSFSLKEEAAANELGGVHTGNPKYAHLSSLSMDDICARVVLYGVNPSHAPEEL